MQTITICSSSNFYRQAADIEKQLTEQGYNVVLPDLANTMKASGDYDVSHYKTWHADAGDYHKKGELMHGHFDKVAAGDSILVLNYEKNGVDNYIGGNVLMEMALAFHLGKPIAILNETPEVSAYLEEILGFEPIVLHGDLDALTPALEKATAQLS